MASTDRRRSRTAARAREPQPQRGPVNSEVALALAVAWSALRVSTAAVFVVPCRPCRASSLWPSTLGARGRGPTRTRARSPSSCCRTSGTSTRRPRGRSGRRRPRRGAASSGFAGCFCGSDSGSGCGGFSGCGGGGGGRDARALWPCEYFTACCPLNVMCRRFFCLTYRGGVLP